MKHQQVSVDYWAMGKAMVTYGALTALCWLMMRLFHAVFALPRRMRSQQEQMQESLKELQKRYPNLNITEEDLINAEKELEEMTKEAEKERAEKLAEQERVEKQGADAKRIEESVEETKKTL